MKSSKINDSPLRHCACCPCAACAACAACLLVPTLLLQRTRPRLGTRPAAWPGNSLSKRMAWAGRHGPYRCVQKHIEIQGVYSLSRVSIGIYTHTYESVVYIYICVCVLVVFTVVVSMCVMVCERTCPSPSMFTHEGTCLCR